MTSQTTTIFDSGYPEVIVSSKEWMQRVAEIHAPEGTAPNTGVATASMTVVHVYAVLGI